MQAIIISGSRNPDGQTARAAKALLAGLEAEGSDSIGVDRQQFGVERRGSQLVLAAHPQSAAVPNQRAVPTFDLAGAEQQRLGDTATRLVAAQAGGQHARRVGDQQIAVAQQGGEGANLTVSDAARLAIEEHDSAANLLRGWLLGDLLRRV